MRDELARSMAELRLDTMPRPYFLSYRIDEITNLTATATRGSLTASRPGRSRRLSLELRVGDYSFDNTNFFGMPRGSFATMIRDLDIGMGELPLDDDYGAIRRQLWLATDRAYKSAVATFAQKRTSFANRTRRDSLPDFTRDDPVTLFDDTPLPQLNPARAEALVREASAVFRNAPEIYQSEVTWSGGGVHTRYVNSEGTSFTRTVPWGSVHVSATTQATDGMTLNDELALYAVSPDQLPPRDALTRRVQDFAMGLTRLRATVPSQTYNGPVLFEGEAAAQLFASVFGARLGANRLPQSDNPMFERFAGIGRGLLDQVGSRVLPRSFSVIENPSVRVFEGKPIGGTLIDDEGVRTRETKLVDHGVLRTLLTTRVPVTGIARSTGSRRNRGAAVTNLFVVTDSGLGDAQLRERALAVAKQNGNGYAIVVRRLGGGGSGPRGFAAFVAEMSGAAGGAMPVADAVKVYPDGHEEPLRGATLTGMTTATFKDIVAASRTRVATSVSGSGVPEGEMMALRSVLPASFRGAFAADMATYVVPSLLFDDLSIRKASGDHAAPPAYGPPWSTR
jgi:predicted Zn-dependent protease